MLRKGELEAIITRISAVSRTSVQCRCRNDVMNEKKKTEEKKKFKVNT